jgi:hypothetical protein
MAETSLPTSRLAIVSLSAAVLTLFSFCGGVAPIPLTGWVCFPAAIFLGLVALVSGLAALRRTRNDAENGRWMALTGIILGGLTIFATLCAVTLTISAIAAFITQAMSEAKP